MKTIKWVFFALILLAIIANEGPWLPVPTKQYKVRALEILRQAWREIKEIDWTKTDKANEECFERMHELPTDPGTNEPFVVSPSIGIVMDMAIEERHHIPIVVSKPSRKTQGYCVLYGDGTVEFVPTHGE